MNEAVNNAVLVVGGAGYIGSHMVQMLLDAGHQVTVLDDLSKGYRDALPGGDLVDFIEGDLGDPAILNELFSQHNIGVVMHFAAFIEVGESVQEPAKYYENNYSKTVRLLDAMREHSVDKFIFSSTAAIFGEPQYVPIDEAHPKNPINPYGRSKWMVEQTLQDYGRAYGLQSVCLRYFNAAGADPQGRLGERHDPETHLLPLILQAASGRRADIKVFGRDYDTPDGTCIRDYIHIVDLCRAHQLAMEHLLSGGDSKAYNLGNGNGFSVQEVIDVTRKVTGVDFTVTDAARRAGDPARLVADSRLIREEFNWQPEFGSLENIVEHAWAWEQKLNKC